MASSRLTCPECNATLKPAQPVPDGKKVKCPKCGAVFVAPGLVSPQGVEEPAEQAPAPKAKKQAVPAAKAKQAAPAKAGAKKPAAKKKKSDDDEEEGGTYAFAPGHAPG